MESLQRLRHGSVGDDSIILDHLSRLKASASQDIVHSDPTTTQHQDGLDPAASITLSDSTIARPAPQEVLVTSAPYAAMLGVVFLGVGMMAYLNGWQTLPRER